MLPRQEAKLPSLGGELRFHTLHGMPKYKIKKETALERVQFSLLSLSAFSNMKLQRLPASPIHSA